MRAEKRKKVAKPKNKWPTYKLQPKSTAEKGKIEESMWNKESENNCSEKMEWNVARGTNSEHDGDRFVLVECHTHRVLSSCFFSVLSLTSFLLLCLHRPLLHAWECFIVFDTSIHRFIDLLCFSLAFGLLLLFCFLAVCFCFVSCVVPSVFLSVIYFFPAPIRFVLVP